MICVMYIELEKGPENRCVQCFLILVFVPFATTTKCIRSRHHSIGVSRVDREKGARQLFIFAYLVYLCMDE